MTNNQNIQEISEIRNMIFKVLLICLIKEVYEYKKRGMQWLRKMQTLGNKKNKGKNLSMHQRHKAYKTSNT